MDELSLSINEMFLSLQGESSQAGRPCTFVRLKGCPLRCSWCDSEYAFFEGAQMTFSEILARVRDFGCSLVEVTGGEPLAQKNCVPFLEKLVTEGFEVMLETSGAFDITHVPKVVRIIMDIKAPGSGEEKRNLWNNLQILKPGTDELKIVVRDRADFDYALSVCESRKLFNNFTILLSAVVPTPTSKDGLDHAVLADWILESRKPFRFQHQLHKMLWPSKERGF